MSKEWMRCSLILFCILFCFLLCRYNINEQMGINYPTNIQRQNNESINDVNRGNLVGNIANDGYVLYKDNWIYYYDVNKNSLYKVKGVEINSTKITADAGFNINITDSWIIYVSERNKKIYRVRFDGTQKEKINDDKSNYVNVLGNWIYYVNVSDSNRIYKMKLDGSQRTKLNNMESARINVVSEWIYYCKIESETTEEFGDNFYSPYGEIYKIKVDGTKVTKISSKKASFLNVVHNWIYYSDVKDSLNLYKMRIDGTEVTKMIDANCYYVNVSDDNMYFSDMSSGLFKVDLNGKNKTSIGVKGRYMNINVAGEWLFFKLETGDEEGFYKVKKDSTELTKITSTNLEQTNRIVITKEQVLSYIAEKYVGREGLMIKYLQEKNRYGISWDNPGGGSGGYWEVDIATGDVFSALGKLIGNVYDK
ncbi:MAG: DUF5050 domain-containing protein [Clostridia bacterium]|nr:DUF5050 domain-containing protein [Clostridia bacterium]